VGDDVYEIYAVRYATNQRRRRVENLIYLAPDDAHDGPMPMDFFVWALVGGRDIVLVDTGSDATTCAARGHDFLRDPLDGLRAAGLDGDCVKTVITTHLHWDHAGNVAAFPQARLHVQRAEMAHVCGPSMGRPFLRRPYDFDQVTEYLRALYGGRVTFHDGADELAPGLSIHHVGGHTPGMQVVRVNTRRGHVVLASDSMHYYENLRSQNPFPVLVSTIDYVAALETVTALAASPDHIIPGHDPAVIETYPSAVDGTAGIAVRLDVDPVPVEAVPLAAGGRP
jgi:glyoxylase-like metal-dependent hydrolase (beta-lactamase superfamily II)